MEPTSFLRPKSKGGSMRPLRSVHRRPGWNRGVAGGSLQLFNQPIGPGVRFGSRTDQLDLRLDLTGVTTLAGDYTGTLNLQAIVQ